MGGGAYNWEYLGSKAWFRLLNVLVGVGAVILTLGAWIVARGSAAYTYYASSPNTCGSNGRDAFGLLCSPVRFSYPVTVPGTPFHWDWFIYLSGIGVAVLVGFWLAVVYILAGSKARKREESRHSVSQGSDS